MTNRIFVAVLALLLSAPIAGCDAISGVDNPHVAFVTDEDVYELGDTATITVTNLMGGYIKVETHYRSRRLDGTMPPPSMFLAVQKRINGGWGVATIPTSGPIIMEGRWYALRHEETFTETIILRERFFSPGSEYRFWVLTGVGGDEVVTVSTPFRIVE